VPGNLAGNRRPQRRERQATRERILELFQDFQNNLQEETHFGSRRCGWGGDLFKQQSCNGAWWQVSINESLRFDGFSVTEMVQPVQPFAWIFAKVFDIENLKTQARFLGKNAQNW